MVAAAVDTTHESHRDAGRKFELAVSGVPARDPADDLRVLGRCPGPRAASQSRILDSDDHRAGAETGIRGDLQPRGIADFWNACRTIAGNRAVSLCSYSYRDGNSADWNIYVFRALDRPT